MIAFFALGCIVVICVVFAGVLRSTTRQQARERDLLLNQLLNLAGKPWQPAPAQAEPAVEEVDLDRFVFSPEQDAY